MSMSKSKRLRRARQRAARQKLARINKRASSRLFIDSVNDAKRKLKAGKTRTLAAGQKALQAAAQDRAKTVEVLLYQRVVTPSVNPVTTHFEKPKSRA